MKSFKRIMMRDFGLTSEESDNAFDIAQKEVLQDMAKANDAFNAKLREVLIHVMDSTQDDFYDLVDRVGEDNPILDHHVFDKAMTVFLGFNFEFTDK